MQGELIGIASDHGGRELKKRVLAYLQEKNLEFKDYGVHPEQSGSVDYPDYGGPVAAAVSSGKLARGILICGTGIGMCITANKHPRVRAVSVWDEFTARVTRQHNNANIICLGERVLNHDRALDCLDI